MPEPPKTLRQRLLRYTAIAIFSIVAISLLALLVFFSASRWCIDDNGCLFYRDNRWVTLWIGLPLVGVAFSSALGAWFAYRGSRLAATFGALMLLLLLPIGWIASLMAGNDWR